MPGQMPMHIHCLGLNHHTASLHLRESLAFSEPQINAALARQGCGNMQIGSISELAILSTCNRVEIYAVGTVIDFQALEHFLAEIQEVQPEAFADSIYRLVDLEATRHLFEVAAGLDSMVVGEPQILGQVTQAFAMARAQNTTGKVLAQLFQSAIRTGKRARTETSIARNPSSIASVAVQLASAVVSDLSTARVVLVGAGEMAESTLHALHKRGVTQFRIINRTLERAQQLASQWEGEAATFENLADGLAWADILISSTSAPHTLIYSSAVAEAMLTRSQRPLVAVDIAVPRDIDPEVTQIAGVNLYDIDSLQEHLDQAVALRIQEVPQVEHILEEELQAFVAFMETLDILPIIAGLRQKAEQIRRQELEKTLRRLPALSPSEQAHLEAMTTALVKKLLHDPIQQLRAAAGGPDIGEYAFISRALFGLNGGQQGQPTPLSKHTPLNNHHYPAEGKTP